MLKGKRLIVAGVLTLLIGLGLCAPAFPQNAVQKGEGGFSINYEGDIKQVIKSILDELGFSYVIDTSVRGNVSVRTGKKLRKDEVMPFLRVILSGGGFRIREDGGVYTVEKVKLQSIPMLPVYTDEEIEKMPKEQRLVLMVLPLRETRAESMAKIVSAYLSATGRLSFAPEVNALLIVDYPKNLISMKALVDILDVNKFALKILTLRIADAEDVVQELDKIFAVEKRTHNLSFVPLKRINAVMVRNTNESMLAEIEKWVGSLDKKVTKPVSTEKRTYYYAMSNKNAAQVAAILNSFHSEVDRLKNGEPKAGEDKDKNSGNDFIIVPDKLNNALLIYATETRYKELLRTLEMLDKRSKQILVEVLIAEVRLDKSTSLGIEWSIRDIVGNYTHTYGVTSGLGSSFDSGTGPFGTGLNYLVFKTGKLLGFLNALQQEEKLSVLSSPYLMATDNVEATTNVIDEVPITNRTINNDIVTESTEYRDAGIKLSIIPHINDKNMVSLELIIESSEVVANTSPPKFFRRKVKTLVSVGDNQTLFIGGLIQRHTTKYVRGVPGLVRVPVVGRLFGNSRDAAVGTELIIVLTPRIIDSMAQADALTKMMQAKIATKEVADFKDENKKPKKKSWSERRREKRENSRKK